MTQVITGLMRDDASPHQVDVKSGTVVKPEEHPATVPRKDIGAAPEDFAGSLIDERFAENVRTTRESLGLSQGELARQMAERGWPYYAQTVHRIESGQRKVSVGEAKSLAELLRTTMDRLTWPGREASAVGIFEQSLGRAQRAQHQIVAWAKDLLYAQRQLRSSLAEAEKVGYLGSARVKQLAEETREALSISPEDAVAIGREEHDDVIDAVLEHNEWAALVTDVVRYYTEEGESIRSTAQLLGIPERGVREILVEQGVEIRQRRKHREASSADLGQISDVGRRTGTDRIAAAEELPDGPH